MCNAGNNSRVEDQKACSVFFSVGAFFEPYQAPKDI